MLVVSLTLTLDDTWDEYDEISKELLCEDIMEHFYGLGCESAEVTERSLIKNNNGNSFITNKKTS